MFWFFLCMPLLFNVHPAAAQAVIPTDPDIERIRSFTVEASIDRGDDLLINEAIVYDFGILSHHGIFRNIPRYFVVGYRKLDAGLQVLSVTRDNQPDVVVQDRGSDQLVIKIGSPNTLISDQHDYRLIYQVSRSIVETPRGQRLSWNVTGDTWPVEIVSSTFRLDAPAAPLEVACFRGPSGSTSQTGCTVSASGTHIVANIQGEPLNPREGWTVDLLFPLGTFVPAIVDTERHLPWLAPWCVFTAVFLLLWVALWYFFGRDARGRGTIIPEYDPPAELKPYQVNALQENGLTHRGLAATILDLARRNVLQLTILDDGERFRLERYRAGERDLDSFESGIIKLLFLHGDEVTDFAQNTEQAAAYAALRADVHKQMKKNGWHQWNVAFVRGLTITLAISLWLASFVLLVLYTYDPLLGLCVLGLGGGILFAYNMPKRTPEGALLYEHIQGFKRYVHVAEKDRLAFHEAPARTPERFSKLLPFAVALGLEKAWSKMFEGITLTPGANQQTHWTAMQVGAFAHVMSSDVRSLATAPSRSGGSGGFSGGGVGGGGGGSW